MYYFVFIIGIILSLMNDKKKISFKIYFAILLLLSFFRFGVGADFFAYKYLFNRLSENILIEFIYGFDEQELIFRLLGSVFKRIGFSYQHYLMFFSTVNMVFIGKLCKKYSKNPTLSLLVYYCFYYFVWTFSGIRQGATLAIGIYYLLECLETNNTKKILIITGILTLIHSSSVIILLLYVIGRLKIEKKRKIIILIISIVISVLPVGVIVYKSSWLPFYSKILPYIDNNSSLKDYISIQSLGRFVFLAIAFSFYYRFKNDDKKSSNIIEIYFFGIIIYFLFKFSELTAARLSIYGVILNIIVLPNIYYMNRSKAAKFIYITWMMLFCLLYFNKELHTMANQSGLMNHNRRIVPYTNIFNKNEYYFKNEILKLLRLNK